jgi:two-component sensor histidine kinase
VAWVETGGPPVSRPTSKGFGTRSVIASIETQLGGKADFDWRREGLICRLTVPLQGRQRAESGPPSYREMPAQTGKPVLNSRTA